MNIQNNCSMSFGSGYITKKGKEELTTKPIYIIEDTVGKLEQAKDSKVNDLIYGDDGCFYIKNKKTGESFTINNPAREEFFDNTMICDVRTPEGKVYTKNFDLTKKECDKLTRSFSPGSYIPQMNFDLFRSIEATNSYKSAIIDEKLNKFLLDD